MRIHLFNKGLFSTLIILSVIMAPSVNYAAQKWLDKVLVLVEDDVILDSEFKRRLITIKKQLQDNKTTLPSDEMMKEQVMERLIMDQIQQQMAAKSGVRISDSELNVALQKIAETNNATIAEMKQQVELDGLNFSLFREDIRSEMVIARYRQGAVSRNVFVSEQEVDDILTLIEERGASSIQYHLRHLMIAVAESAGPDELDQAKEKAESIIARVKEGEAFSAIVVAESDGSDALKGGDMEWKTREQLPPIFADTISDLGTGQVTPPIRSANGFHLLYLEEKKGEVDRSMVGEVNYRHILIEVSTITTDAKAEAKLLLIRKEISEGNADFAEQAKVYSEDLGTASLGGDLGWASPKVFRSLYLGKVDTLKDGELSEVFKGSDGWYLVEQLGSRISDQTDEVKRMQARRIIQNRKYAEEQESWLREIRESAYVKTLGEKD